LLRDTIVHLLRDNYTEAKIRGKKSHLLEKQQLQSLTEFRTQSEIVAFLADSPYGPELSKLSESASPAEVERTVRESVARDVENLDQSSKGNVREFINEYRKRFDARELSNLFIYKLQGRPWEEFVQTRHPLATMRERDLRRFYNVDNPRDLAEMIGESNGLDERLEDIPLDNLTPDKTALIRDIIVGWGDERFYSFVSKKLTGRDRSSCLPIVGSMVDLGNVAIILRGKLLALSDIRQHLVPAFWRLDEKTQSLLLASEDVPQALDRVGLDSYYKNVLGGAKQKFEETKSLAFLEVITREHLVHLGHEIFLGVPYNMGVLLSFLVVKENEGRNLTAIISGVDAKLPPERIRPLLAI